MLGLHSILMALRGDVCSLSAAGLAPAATGTSAAEPLQVQYSSRISKSNVVSRDLKTGSDMRDSLFTAAAACSPLGVGADSLQLELVCCKPRSGGCNGGSSGGAGAAGSSDAACDGGVLLSVCYSEGVRLALQPTAARVRELLPGASVRIRTRMKEERAEQRRAEAAAVMLPGSRSRDAKASRRGG